MYERSVWPGSKSESNLNWKTEHEGEWNHSTKELVVTSVLLFDLPFHMPHSGSKFSAAAGCIFKTRVVPLGTATWKTDILYNSRFKNYSHTRKTKCYTSCWVNIKKFFNGCSNLIVSFLFLGLSPPPPGLSRCTCFYLVFVDLPRLKSLHMKFMHMWKFALNPISFPVNLIGFKEVLLTLGVIGM